MSSEPSALMRVVVPEAGHCVVKSLPRPSCPPDGRRVLVRVLATAVNRADTLERKCAATAHV
jgi:NADPH:quinone reductase-like Zn-dependent oxidoreductase